ASDWRGKVGELGPGGGMADALA
ncbi:MAG: hypothetical protein RJA45_615, partial [Actinomycetota bacterium]